MPIIQRLKSWLGASKEEDPLISVVLLLKSPMQLTDQRLSEAIVEAWGRDLREEANEYFVNKPPVIVIRFGEFMLLINNAARPYVSEEYRKDKASAEFKELRQRKVVMEHQAFFTVDLMHPRSPGPRMKLSAYRQMCSLAAQFLDDGCLGVSFPETGYLRPYDNQVKTALQSDDPLAGISRTNEVPVVSASADDAALLAAASEARDRWPEFASAFHARRPDQMFSVKAPFRDDDNVEWIWVTASAVHEETVEGTLDNLPLNLKNVREGDQVHVPRSVISDWIYTDGEKILGGFSLKLLRPTGEAKT